MKIHNVGFLSESWDIKNQINEEQEIPKIIDKDTINTGAKYSEEGQPITVELYSDGTAFLVDFARAINIYMKANNVKDAVRQYQQRYGDDQSSYGIKIPGWVYKREREIWDEHIKSKGL